MEQFIDGNPYPFALLFFGPPPPPPLSLVSLVKPAVSASHRDERLRDRVEGALITNGGRRDRAEKAFPGNLSEIAVCHLSGKFCIMLIIFGRIILRLMWRP